jgi:hypothetical protein
MLQQGRVHLFESRVFHGLAQVNTVNFSTNYPGQGMDFDLAIPHPSAPILFSCPESMPHDGYPDKIAGILGDRRAMP